MRIFVSAAFAALVACTPLAIAADAAPPAHAADKVTAEKLNLAGELIAVSGASRMFSSTDQVLAVIFTQFRKSGINIDSETEAGLKKICREELEAAKPKLLEQYRVIYARHFSEADMRNMIAFDKSPTGQHVVAEMPAVVRETMPLSAELMMKTMKRAMAYMKERAQEKAQEKKDKPAQ